MGEDPQALTYARELRELYRREQARTRELEAAKKALEAAIQRMRHAERVRDEFVANCSHELRTPLTPIVGWADFLRDQQGLTPQEVRGYAAIISGNARRLLEVVESLLIVATLERNRAHGKLEPVDVEAALHQVAQAARRTGRRVHVTVSPEAERVLVDPGDLREVLRRLVDNAVKFTPAGSPLRLAARREQGEVVFAVTDHGLGVPPSERDRIFESFVQEDASSTRGRGGLGVGLYICRELVRSYGGRIWVEGTPGGGATFVFTLSQGPSGGDAGGRVEEEPVHPGGR